VGTEAGTIRVYGAIDPFSAVKYIGSTDQIKSKKLAGVRYEMGSGRNGQSGIDVEVTALKTLLNNVLIEDRYKAEQLMMDIYSDTIINQKRAYPNNTKYHEWLANLPSYINKQLTEAELNVVLNS
jgi:hypothetical protein